MRYFFTNIILLLSFMLLTASCGAPQQHASPGPRGTLRFNCQPENAILEIDETLLGPVGLFKKQGVLLKPGVHRLTIRAEGYFDHYLLVKVINSQLQIIKIDLRPKPN